MNELPPANKNAYLERDVVYDQYAPAVPRNCVGTSLFDILQPAEDYL